MKQVSIFELKQNLSGYLEEAVHGEPIVITKHKKPWAKLTAADSDHVWVGPRVGKVSIKRVLKKPLPARAWQLLADDRAESLERLV